MSEIGGYDTNCGDGEIGYDGNRPVITSLPSTNCGIGYTGFRKRHIKTSLFTNPDHRM